ncbi:MAG TPA: hypothetical protein VMA34_15280 [Terracidiphilus sp.]|nr:hypothetical protein [Terracidiphilus sp.]
MNIDLRIPTGMMFTLVGAVLMAFGLSTRENPAFYAQAMGIDVNLWWGVVLLAFGLLLVALGRRGQARIEKGHGDIDRSKPAAQQVSRSAGQRKSK